LTSTDTDIHISTQTDTQTGTHKNTPRERLGRREASLQGTESEGNESMQHFKGAKVKKLHIIRHEIDTERNKESDPKTPILTPHLPE
jgi:hypothetical protein